MRGGLGFAASQFRAPRSRVVEKVALISDATDFSGLIGWQQTKAVTRVTLMNTRLYVGNLSFHATQDTVRQAFEKHGTVTDVHIVNDRESGQSRGFGFVTMGSPTEAQAAMNAMNDVVLDGRPLKVNQAEERKPRAR